jgi:NAD(P)H-flavin reductase
VERARAAEQSESGCTAISAEEFRPCPVVRLATTPCRSVVCAWLGAPQSGGRFAFGPAAFVVLRYARKSDGEWVVRKDTPLAVSDGQAMELWMALPEPLGVMTRWVVEDWEAGVTVVGVRGPFSSVVDLDGELRRHRTRRVVCFGAGTAVVSGVQMALSVVADGESETRVQLVCACRARTLLACRERVRAACEYWNVACVWHVASRSTRPVVKDVGRARSLWPELPVCAHAAGYGDRMTEQRIDADVVRGYVGDAASTAVFVSGGDAFVQSLMEWARAAGVGFAARV